MLKDVEVSTLTPFLPVSDHRSKTFLNRRNLMSSLDPDEIKRVKVHVVKCPKCKLTVKVKPSEKKCPKCKYTLNRPSPEVIEKLRALYRKRQHYNRALDRIFEQIEREYYLPPSERVPAERERERKARSLVEVSAQINKLLSKQEYYKKRFDENGKVLLPDWIYEVTGGRPGPSQVE
jgi:hypothetical protein